MPSIDELLGGDTGSALRDLARKKILSGMTGQGRQFLENYARQAGVKRQRERRAVTELAASAAGARGRVTQGPLQSITTAGDREGENRARRQALAAVGDEVRRGNREAAEAFGDLFSQDELQEEVNRPPEVGRQLAELEHRIQKAGKASYLDHPSVASGRTRLERAQAAAARLEEEGGRMADPAAEGEKRVEVDAQGRQRLVLRGGSGYRPNRPADVTRVEPGGTRTVLGQARNRAEVEAILAGGAQQPAGQPPRGPVPAPAPPRNAIEALARRELERSSAPTGGDGVPALLERRIGKSREMPPPDAVAQRGMELRSQMGGGRKALEEAMARERAAAEAEMLRPKTAEDVRKLAEEARKKEAFAAEQERAQSAREDLARKVQAEDGERSRRVADERMLREAANLAAIEDPEERTRVAEAIARVGGYDPHQALLAAERLRGEWSREQRGRGGAGGGDRARDLEEQLSAAHLAFRAGTDPWTGQAIESEEQAGEVQAKLDRMAGDLRYLRNPEGARERDVQESREREARQEKAEERALKGQAARAASAAERSAVLDELKATDPRALEKGLTEKDEQGVLAEMVAQDPELSRVAQRLGMAEAVARLKADLRDAWHMSAAGAADLGGYGPSMWSEYVDQMRDLPALAGNISGRAVGLPNFGTRAVDFGQRLFEGSTIAAVPTVGPLAALARMLSGSNEGFWSFLRRP